MSINFIEGFDDGLTLGRWNFSGGVAADISASYGRNGKGCRVGDTPSNSLTYTFDADYTYVCIGFAVYVVDYGGDAATLLTFDANNYYRLLIDASNQRIGYYNQLLSTDWAANNSFTPNTWHYVEVLQYTADSGGSYEVTVDGSTLLSASGIDTKYSGYSNVRALFASSVDDVYIDDVWVRASDSALTMKGDIEAVTLLPSGNGTTSDMLGSDADSTDNHLLVDNNAAIPPATTEYVGSATEGDTDTYAMDDVSGTPTVLAVQTTLYAAMTDTGPKSIRPVIRSGTTDYSGTSRALQNSVYIPIDEVWETDPDTATAWTYGAVNAMEVGQEVRDS